MEKDSNDISKCPFHNGSMKPKAAGGGTRNQDWWPNQLKLSILRQNSSLSNPMGAILTMRKHLTASTLRP
jgi:catalase-peroxidase